MIRHIFLDKTATIIKNMYTNTGLNPVAELNYGGVVTRILLHFDESDIKKMVDDKTIDPLKTRFVLKMTNCAGIDGVPYGKPLKFGNTCIEKERASSFTVLAMEIPSDFDEGRGFEFTSDTWIGKNKSYSTSGCNWFQAYNGKDWETPGVYSLDKIREEYTKYGEGLESLVIDRQKFDFGDENLEIDLTPYVLKVIEETEPEDKVFNNGILLCFSPATEEMETKMQQYVGFFTDHTNTFFHPYLEIQYNVAIMDDREALYPHKHNKLYLYANIGGQPENLDEMPTCEFDGEEVHVEQVTKGVYCAKFLLNDDTPNKICYDVWSNIKYNGIELDDVEMESVILPKSGYFQIGSKQIENDEFVPSVYGINEDEGVRRGDIREVVVDFRKKYTTNERLTTIYAYYRLYVKDGNREIDILNGYQPVERAFLKNYFLLYTGDLIPNNKYFVDIKVKSGLEEKFFKNVLNFRIVDNVTERYV